MLEFLALCGFDEQESRAHLPRVREVFARLGIAGEDVERAKIRLNTYYDMELQGVRKLMGIFLRDLCNIVLMRDDGRERIVHACMLPQMDILGSAIMENSTEVGLISPNATFMVVMGGMFDRYVPILEAAEKQWLKGGVVAHCGMVKSRVGLIRLNMIPKPDLTITAGFACDTSPKVNELLEEVYGIPACYVDTCQDRELREYPDATRATVFAAKSMRAACRRIEKETGFGITDDMLWEVLEARVALDGAMGRLTDLIRRSDPMPIGSTHLNLLTALGCVSFKGNELAEAVDALDTLHDELLERARKGVGATPKGAPRVLAIFPHHHSDPRWEYLANQMGLAIVAFDFQGSSERGVSGAGVVDPNDPYDVIVQSLHGSFTQPLGARVAIVLDMCRRLGIDGVLNHYHVGCRYVVGDALILRDAILKELGIPVLMLEWDNFDPRSYEHEQYEAKLEIFRSMMEGAGSRD
jgi:benzoyl-CoA reductase/2-hydroxyglutaryl-CoA dehydratase subunit BcrC/BadD/HgdB